MSEQTNNPQQTQLQNVIQMYRAAGPEEKQQLAQLLADNPALENKIKAVLQANAPVSGAVNVSEFLADAANPKIKDEELSGLGLDLRQYGRAMKKWGWKEYAVATGAAIGGGTGIVKASMWLGKKLFGKKADSELTEDQQSDSYQDNQLHA